MTRPHRAVQAAVAAAFALAVLTGCGSHGGSSAATPGSTSPQPAASQLAHMKKLVDDADSAASAADSDAAHDN